MKNLFLAGFVALTFFAGCSSRCSMSPAAADDAGYSCGKAKCASCSSCKASKSCEQGKGCSSCPHKHSEGGSCSGRK